MKGGVKMAQAVQEMKPTQPVTQTAAQPEAGGSKKWLKWLIIILVIVVVLVGAYYLIF